MNSGSNSLNVLGMDTACEAVYRRLLALSGESQQGLADSLGLSDRALSVALERLRVLGFVRPAAEPPHQLHAVSPHLGMEILLSRQEAELGARQQRLREGRAAAARLLGEFPPPGGSVPQGGVEFLDGLDSIRDFLEILNSEVGEEMLAFAPGGAQTGANMRASRPLNRRLLERGVRMRTVYLESLRRDRASVAHAEWLTLHGGEVRTTSALPNRMIICDRRVALVAVDSEHTGAGAVVLRTRGLVETLCALFDETWRRADPLGAPQRRDTTGFTPQQAEALRLLSQGHTDQAVGKRLGVSPRTARRTAAEVMARLDARSRFQAGVLAAQRGHLPRSYT
ncbi:helix-turn-helix domain-containing protein [Streptomyces sp. NPDC003006]